ncbi:MAG: DUF3105 domain-containing protein [Chloroflexi bacterium]|nr:DUF3105 domain-containing protein [Chloroflexota bacterium]
MAARQKERRKQADRRAIQRDQRRARSEGRKRRRRFLYLGLSGFIAVLIIASFAVSALPQGTGSGGGKRVQYVDGIGAPQPLLPTTTHLDGRTVSYSTVPPTSGDHWGTPTQCGFYETEVRDEIVVHNMEHGDVILSFNLPDSADVARLKEVVSGLGDSGTWLVTRPYAKLAEGEVALTAWGVLDRFTGVDEERVKRFFDAYKGNLFSDETRSQGQGIPCTSNPRMAK